MKLNCKITVVCNNINIEAKITELGFVTATTNQGCSKLLDSLSSYIMHSIQANAYDGNVISHK
jgi:hypothetical protein